MLSAGPALAAPPDFGPNVVIFNPSQTATGINATLATLTNRGQEFGAGRSQIFFMPGTYGSAEGPTIPLPRPDSSVRRWAR